MPTVQLSVGPGTDIPPDRIFFASNAASTSSADLNATYTGGVIIINPLGSGLLVVPLWVSSSLPVIETSVNVGGCFMGFGTITAHTTPLTIQSAAGSTASPGPILADQACTLVGTPKWVMMGGSTGIAASSWGFTLNVAGLFTIPPGGYFGTVTQTASAASGHQAVIGFGIVNA